MRSKDKIHRYFKRVDVKFKPFPFQEKVITNILSGRNVILQAPTGSGKTLAGIMPFLIAESENILFPRKLIYSVPLRSLANKFVLDVSEDLKNFSNRDGNRINVTIQTGEKPDDEHFDNGDIVFTTYDQSLSSLLCIPVGLSRRQANVNAGAVASSYLVFDEIHLYEMGRSLATTLTLLKWLGNYTRFLLMTATLTDSLKKNITEFIGGDIVVIEVSEEELNDIPSQKDKDRSVLVEDSHLTPEIIKDKHNNGRTIVVCNTVKKTQRLYERVKEILPDKEVILLHSRFLSTDRSTKEEKVDELFGKERRKEKTEAILIATQVVEVGLDITCDTMLTEVAEAPAVIQRMGRCARFRGESGTLHLFDVDKVDENGKDKKRPYLPYNDDLTNKTLDVLKEYSGENLTYSNTLEIVDRVMSDYEDEKFIKSIKWNKTNIKDKALETINIYDIQKYNELIRDICSTNILICDDSKLTEDFNPFKYIPFSIDRRVVKGFLYKISKSKDNDTWVAKEVIENTEGDEYQSKYRFVDFEDPDGYPPEFLILNPIYLSYSDDIGLLLNPEGSFSGRDFKLIEKEDKSTRYDGKYPKELYHEHIERCMEASVKYREEVSWLYNQLARDMGFEEIKDDLIDIMLFAHDLGKLDEEWQNAHKREEGEYIAHGERLRTPKPHASVGAYVSCLTLPVLLKEKLHNMSKEEIGSITRPLMSAIAKHHSVGFDGFKSFNFSKKAIEYLSNSNQYRNFDEFIKKMKDKFINYKGSIPTGILNLGKNRNMLLMYLLYTRILRLSDQKATKLLKNEEE